MLSCANMYACALMHRHCTCRFREQGLSELLETVYAMMGLPFLTALRDSLRAGSSWQEAEGALYCLKAVHACAKVQAAAGGSVGQETNEVRRAENLSWGCPTRQFIQRPQRLPCWTGDAEFGKDQAHFMCNCTCAPCLCITQAINATCTYSSTHTPSCLPSNTHHTSPNMPQVLLSIFGELCSPSSTVASSLAHPLVCQTAAGAIGAYAAWFGSTEASPLEGALQLLLHALAHRESWQDAAQAFRALCCRCASRLAGSGAFMGLMDVAARAVAPLPSAGQVGILRAGVVAWNVYMMRHARVYACKHAVPWCMPLEQLPGT